MGWDRGHFSKLSAFLVNKRGYDYRVIPLNDALVMTWGQLRISCTCVFKVFRTDRVENFWKLQPHGLFMSHTSQTGAGRKIHCGTKKICTLRSDRVKWNGERLESENLYNSFRTARHKKTHVLNLSIVSHFAVIWFYLGNSLLYNECDETGRHEGHTQCKEDGKQKSRKITCDIVSLERKKQSEIKNLSAKQFPKYRFKLWKTSTAKSLLTVRRKP